MTKNIFDEWSKTGHKQPIELDKFIDQLQFNDQGLIPAIAQQKGSLEVLMMAWMNKASIKETLSTGQVCYWSRSRQTYWRKGESSGHTQKLISMSADCDGDTLLLTVDQTGAACHTYRRSCFFFEVNGDHVSAPIEPEPSVK